MSCEDLALELMDAGRGLPVDPVTAGHLSACPRCRETLRQQKAISRTLREWRPVSHPSPLIELALREELRRNRRPGSAWFGAAAAVAASLLLVWAIPQPGPELSLSVQAPVIPAPVLARATSRPTTRARHKPLRRPAAPVAPAASEVATEFLPLTPGEFFTPAAVVRMQLPRATLTSFGLPINQNRWAERVKADVVLGTDGTARAIRFVQ